MGPLHFQIPSDTSSYQNQTWVVSVACHKLVRKSVSYPKIVKNTPILIQQNIACNVQLN